MILKRPLYLDYHATTPCDSAVLTAMLPYFGVEKFGNPNAKAHAHGRRAAEAFENAQTRIAALIGAAAETITLTSGATEANNIALLGVAEAARRTGESRNEIVVGALEHDSVCKTLAALGEKGFVVKTVPSDAGGFITPEAVRALLSDKTLLVSVMAANHEIGTVQPIAQIAQLAQAMGALFHVDAAQAAGKIPLDVGRMKVDMLSFCSHKLYGPAGIGALYVRQKPPVNIAAVFFGGMQQNLRSGTVPLALAMGFGVACDMAQEQMAAQSEKLSAHAALFLKILKDSGAPFFVNGATAPRLSGSLNLRFTGGVTAEDLMLALADDLCLSTGAACASASKKPSAVLKAIGLTDEEIDSSLRLSFGRPTTEEEVVFAAKILGDTAKRLRKSAAASLGD